MEQFFRKNGIQSFKKIKKGPNHDATIVSFFGKESGAMELLAAFWLKDFHCFCADDASRKQAEEMLSALSFLKNQIPLEVNDYAPTHTLA